MRGVAAGVTLYEIAHGARRPAEPHTERVSIPVRPLPARPDRLRLRRGEECAGQQRPPQPAPAQQQAAERRRQLTIAIAATAAVVLVVAVLIGVALFGPDRRPSPAVPRPGGLDAQRRSGATFDQVGSGPGSPTRPRRSRLRP